MLDLMTQVFGQKMEQKDTIQICSPENKSDFLENKRKFLSIHKMSAGKNGLNLFVSRGRHKKSYLDQLGKKTKLYRVTNMFSFTLFNSSLFSDPSDLSLPLTFILTSQEEMKWDRYKLREKNRKSCK